MGFGWAFFPFDVNLNGMIDAAQIYSPIYYFVHVLWSLIFDFDESL